MTFPLSRSAEFVKYWLCMLKALFLSLSWIAHPSLWPGLFCELRGAYALENHGSSTRKSPNWNFSFPRHSPDSSAMLSRGKVSSDRYWKEHFVWQAPAYEKRCCAEWDSVKDPPDGCQSGPDNSITLHCRECCCHKQWEQIEFPLQAILWDGSNQTRAELQITRTLGRGNVLDDGCLNERN